MISKHILYRTFVKSLSCFLHTVNWFRVLLCNSNNLTLIICLVTVCFISPSDRILSGAAIPGQSGPGSNGNKEMLHIPHISKVGALASDCLVAYLGHSLWLLPLCRDAVGLFYTPS